jgi:HK97 family phage major capsid protein
MFKRKINGKWVLVNAQNQVVKNEEGAEVNLSEETAAPLQELKEGETAPEVDADAAKALADYVKGAIGDQIKGLDVQKAFGTEVSKAIGEAFKAQTVEVKGALDVEAIKKGLSGVKGKQGASFEFEVKSLSELSSLTGEVIVPERDTEITRAPVRSAIIETIADVGGTSSNKITYVEVSSESGTGPATTAEIASIPEKDYAYSAYSTDVLKVGVTTKHSTEILEDMPQLVSEVRNMLTEDLNLKVDTLLFNDTGAAGHFNGVYTLAPAFSDGGVIVANANVIDVLRLGIVQIMNAGKGKFMPNAILLNPTDAAKLDLAKDSQGAYVMPPFTTADRTVIKGVRIIETPLVTANTFLMGDFKRLKIRNKRGLSVQVATENSDDFVKDLLTIRATRRLASYVRNNDNGAFVKCTDIGAAVTALAT